ncbi:MAG: hypothetical protein H7145_02765 [Akkermansiaceae bacterium]|nr:hypothetical protein [Armatimonadota bacterium]
MKSDVEKSAETIDLKGIVSLLFRAVLVLLFCWLGATMAFSPMVGLQYKEFPDALVPRFGIAPVLLLGAVVLQARLLSWRGKTSASWAVLAFGSLATCLVTLLVTMVWYEFDVIRERWVGILFLSTLSALCIYFGLGAALRADWGAMFLCSIPTFLIAFVCGVNVNYGQHFYCSRHHLFDNRQDSNTAPSTGVKEQRMTRPHE